MDHKIEEQIKAKYCKHSNYILTTSETVNKTSTMVKHLQNMPFYQKLGP
ncbi:16936_t:CDS:2 [Entrophospora sp. SA101]|nr:16936_t:CDS:2 [Entrophospora sp. SA101]